jgi:hypothetical protein
MRELKVWQEYTREEVHDIFSPQTVFTPQAGTWGLQGMIRVPDRAGDWVFFVTYGQKQGEHEFDESITDDGVLSWQSQPAMGFGDEPIKELIGHNSDLNTIHLFLRTTSRVPYIYLGPLAYITHDVDREMPIHFQWQILDWPPPSGVLTRLNVVLSTQKMDGFAQQPKTVVPGHLELVPPPKPSAWRKGVSTSEFRANKVVDRAERDQKNRQLGREGEELVLNSEKDRLMLASRTDLAEKIVHVSVDEGDGAGYDIRSFEVDGRPRYLEVKTTEGGLVTSFFLSANELSFSTQKADSYHLYRLFEFDRTSKSAKAYVLSGSMSETLELTPTQYRAKLA